jgi:hypothetical protein
MGGNRETKSEVLRVRLTTRYREKLRAYAASHGVSESHVICEYIRRLPRSSAHELSLQEVEVGFSEQGLTTTTENIMDDFA